MAIRKVAVLGGGMGASIQYSDRKSILAWASYSNLLEPTRTYSNLLGFAQRVVLRGVMGAVPMPDQDAFLDERLQDRT